MDDDIYAHVDNNVLNLIETEVTGLVVETQCNYFAPVGFPDRIMTGLNVAHIGNTSVRYDICFDDPVIVKF